jgi:hypothetical protein
VVSNSGKHADLESGLEKKDAQKPTHISASEFIHWLAPASQIDVESLRTYERYSSGDEGCSGARAGGRRRSHSEASGACIFVLDVTKVTYILFNRSDVFLKSV